MSFDLSFSFPKDLKIRRTSQYEEIFGKSRKLNGEHFRILYVRNLLGHPRLGMVVAKKSIPGSVGRNRVKRVLREVFRRNKSLFGSMDLVIIAKKGSEELDYTQAKGEIEAIIGSRFS
jgi:ribonuclease P protein component